VSDGLGSYLKVGALCVFDSLLFVNAQGDHGYYYTAYRPIAEMVPKSDVVQTLSPADTLEIYPNPTLGLITIRSGMPISEVHVLNVLGEEVLDMPRANYSEISLDLSKLPSGTYYARLSTIGANTAYGETQTVKLVKE
jgi:hypothetical protein